MYAGQALVVHSGTAMHGLVDLNGKGAWQYLANLSNTRREACAHRTVSVTVLACRQPAGPSVYAGFGRIQGDNAFKFRIRPTDPMDLLLAG